MSWSEQETAGVIGDRFAEQVRRDPGRAAIAGPARTLTYGQLGALADRYAGALLARPQPAERAALLLDHDGPQLAAAIGALRCGMVVVTLNVGDPPARLRQILAAVEPQVLITDARHLERARAAGADVARTMVLSTDPPDPQRDRIATRPRPDDLAFLICTSGSTGRPKVVMQSHRNVLHNVLRYTNGLGVRPSDRIAWLASLSGGQGLATAWTALLNGATLCPFPIAERGVTGLGPWMTDNGVTVFDTIPSVLRRFAQTLRDERVAGVRLVRIASEGALRSDFDAFKRHFPEDCTLASVLASSEAGIIAQALIGADAAPPEGPLTVGADAAGIALELLDEHDRPVAAGEVGEIVVQGRYLSPGYWRDQALTATRFEAVDGTRRFRTGDLGRRPADGRLIVLGRADSQVKVRGHRLQLEEVEAALARHPDVAAAAVALRKTAGGDARLTAYVSARPGRTPVGHDLRRSLQELLPPYAIPAAIVVLDELPLTAHGKVDRERLDELEPERRIADGATEPSATEQVLLSLFSEALERDLGVHEPFLELGGDSLSAAVIAAGVHERFGVSLDLRVFATDPTVASLAALVERRSTVTEDDELPPLRKAIRSGPLSSAQLRMWSSRSDDRADTRWHVAVPFRIRGPLDAELMRRSVERVVERHEILRTRFLDNGGQPIAVVGESPEFEYAVDDLRHDPDPHARSEQLLDSELLRSYDLTTGPLLRLRLLRLAEDEYRLLRLSHHLIHDALSWRIFFKEVALIYEALADGRPPPLSAEPELQYIDYACWELATLRPDSRHYRSEVGWWARRFEAPVPALELPFARPEPDPRARDSEHVLRWGFTPQQSEALDGIGRAAGATHFMTRLAAFAALLALEAEVEDLVIGTPMSTRNRAELQRMIGPFLNFAMLRLRFSPDAGFRGWLSDVRRAVIDTSAHVSVPWERLMPELRRMGIEIPTVAARFVAWPALGAMRFGGIELEPLPRRCAEVWGFRLGVNREYESDRCWAEFDPRLHDRAAVEGFLGRLQALVAAACAEPDRSLRDLHSAAVLL